MLLDHHHIGILVVNLLVVLLVVPSSAGAAASPEAPCEDIEKTTLVGYFDTNTRVQDGTAVYPRTTLTLYVCTRGDPEPYGSAWKFDSSVVSGLELANERDRSVVVNVRPATTQLQPAKAVTLKSGVSGPTLMVEQGHTAVARLNGTKVMLHFQSKQDVGQFKRSMETFRTKTSAVENASNILMNATRSGGVGLFDSQTTQSLDTIAETNITIANQKLEQAAFAATLSGDITGAQEATKHSNGRSQAVTRGTRRALQTYRSELLKRQSAAAAKVRFVFGSTLMGGLLFGGIAGYVLARRTLKRVEHDRGISTATKYSLRHISTPLAIGILALLAAIAGLAIGGAAFIGVLI